MQFFFKLGRKGLNFNIFESKQYKECVSPQDASFEPLAVSVGPTGWSVAMRKEKREKDA